MSARVCITGLGVVAPIGIGKNAFWNSLLKGESGIGQISLFDASDLSSQIAGEVRGFSLTDHIPGPVKTKRLARHTQFAIAASQMALDDAQIEHDLHRAGYPIPIIVGISTSAMDLFCTDIRRIGIHGCTHARPYTVSEGCPQAVASAIAKHIGVPALVRAVSSACAAGIDAITQAAELIRSERVDIAIAGGADAPISMVPFANFCAAGMSSTCNADPTHASRPFDIKRDTGVISEGSGVIVLENLEHALARGATPYLEIAGWGCSMDEPGTEPGSGLNQTIREAMANSSITPSHLDYVCAHGPSHPVLDRVETDMIKATLGNAAYSTPVSSIKGAIGNPLAAGGPMQVISCALACRAGMVPPTANYEYPDPACDLDYVPGRARYVDLDYALINAHGLGNGNTSMVIRRTA